MLSFLIIVFILLHIIPFWLRQGILAGFVIVFTGWIALGAVALLIERNTNWIPDPKDKPSYCEGSDFRKSQFDDCKGW